jgi:hypothetical protein
MTELAQPEPDDKDWTWVLDQPCPDCGFDGAALDRSQIPALVRHSADAFAARLTAPDATVRPEPRTWSPTEYACHIADVCVVFSQRLELMRSTDDPLFQNWDQDRTAIEQRYWEQQPAQVSARLSAVAEQIAAEFATVRPDEWSRPGRRSNGSLFTVETLGKYFAHDLAHHVHDVSAGAAGA